MGINRECPLCGKNITSEDEELCDDCKSYAENQYKTDFLGNSNSSIINDNKKKENNSNSEQENANPTNKNNNNKKNSKILLFFLLGCLLVVILGIWGVHNVVDAREMGETEEVYWEMCANENTITSYSKYLVRFSDGKYEALAQQRIKELKANDINEWQLLNKSSDINDYFLFTINNPNSIYLDSIKLKIDSIAWNDAIIDGSKDAYKYYLDKVQSGTYEGKYLNDAKFRYNYLSELRPLSTSKSDSLKKHLNELYKAIGVLDKSTLNKILDSRIIYYSDTFLIGGLVDSLKNYTKLNNIEEIQYQLPDSLINAYIDNTDITFVDLIIDKIIKSRDTTKPLKKNQKPKVYTSSIKDTLQIRINKSGKIISINRLKDSARF